MKLQVQSKQNVQAHALNYGHGTVNQCDQMVRLFFQYLAIYNNENLPNRIK